MIIRMNSVRKENISVTMVFLIPGHFRSDYKSRRSMIVYSSCLDSSVSQNAEVKIVPPYLSVLGRSHYVCSGHEVLMEVDDNILLIVGDLRGILDQHLRPHPIILLNITILYSLFFII
jgi:hypothetical protein